MNAHELTNLAIGLWGSVPKDRLRNGCLVAGRSERTHHRSGFDLTWRQVSRQASNEVAVLIESDTDCGNDDAACTTPDAEAALDNVRDRHPLSLFMVSRAT
jgi:hypothetical protein